MGEKILVTGGAGYVGCVLVEKLLLYGYHVKVLDRFRHRQPGLLHLMSDPNLEIIKGDCRDSFLLKASLKGVDWIIPLAAVVGAPACEADRYAARTINFDAVCHLLNLLSPEQKVLFPTTNSGYGVSDIPCTEETPLKPVSLYGRTKVEAEEAVLRRSNALSFRFATAFGPSLKMRLDLLVNDFTYRAWKDRSVILYEGHFRRNFIHVQDMASAFLHGIAKFEQMRGQAYNCGLPASLTKLQLCQEIQKQLPQLQYFEAPVGKDPDQRDYEIDNTKLQKAGFVPQTSLQQGITELIKAYPTLPAPEFTNQ